MKRGRIRSAPSGSCFGGEFRESGICRRARDIGLRPSLCPGKAIAWGRPTCPTTDAQTGTDRPPPCFVISSEARNLSAFLRSLTSTAPPLRSSPTLSNTPRPIPTVPAHTPQTPHRESPAHSASHLQNSIPRRHTLPRRPTIPQNSAASASPLPPTSHDPCNSHTQIPPAAPLALPFAGTQDSLQRAVSFPGTSPASC